MNELQQAEKDLFELTQRVAELRKDAPLVSVKNYVFEDTDGNVSLKALFGSNKILFLIHNMGQGCQHCTLWADGLNGFIPHIESEFALALVSKDNPDTQRRMANSRQWRFKMASHGGGEYISEQSVLKGENNMPGIVCYVLEDGEIFRKNSAIFGPGDEFCSQWNLLSLAGISENEWVPQYDYWNAPSVTDDDSTNLNE
ncbi:MAG: DUF899 family protein [Pseudomonadales bacterium]|nr:DUF899 family protein [Pseudomonadales bacterium]